MARRNPDASPSPVDLLTLDHSQLFLRRMKEEEQKKTAPSLDYEELEFCPPEPPPRDVPVEMVLPPVDRPKPKT
ncbi:unnamed protein product, partial [Nesidiocoris tenuis]